MAARKNPIKRLQPSTTGGGLWVFANYVKRGWELGERGSYFTLHTHLTSSLWSSEHRCNNQTNANSAPDRASYLQNFHTGQSSTAEILPGNAKLQNPSKNLLPGCCTAEQQQRNGNCPHFPGWSSASHRTFTQPAGHSSTPRPPPPSPPTPRPPPPPPQTSCQRLRWMTMMMMMAIILMIGGLTQILFQYFDFGVNIKML